MFSGIGGIDLGFKQVGCKIIWANEVDSDAVKTYNYNFRDNTMLNQDIRNVNAKAIPDFEILIAGFPCQSFSVMGYQRGFKDSRGNLFFEILRVINEKKPKIVFLENVKNLIAHDNGKTFLVIHSALAQFGYIIKYKVMDSSEYGNIPQNRSRIFVVAFRDYDMCNRFTFPEPIALKLSINDIVERSVPHSEIYYYDSSNKYFSQLNEKILDKDSIYRIDDSGVAMRRYTLCPTLKANMGTYHDRVPIIRDDFGIRKLTPKECLAFQGFPSEFLFPKIPIESAYKQAGNTVSVPLIRRIADKVMQAF